MKRINVKSRGPAKATRDGSKPAGELAPVAPPVPPTFSGRVIDLIRRIPRGKVSTYRQIAASAGNIFAARQVAWLLHSSTRKHRLPWHRVVNSEGRISLKPGHGYELQRRLLREEGVGFRRDGSIDLERYLWTARRLKPRRPAGGAGGGPPTSAAERARRG